MPRANQAVTDFDRCCCQGAAIHSRLHGQLRLSATVTSASFLAPRRRHSCPLAKQNGQHICHRVHQLMDKQACQKRLMSRGVLYGVLSTRETGGQVDAPQSPFSVHDRHDDCLGHNSHWNYDSGPPILRLGCFLDLAAVPSRAQVHFKMEACQRGRLRSLGQFSDHPRYPQPALERSCS